MTAIPATQEAAYDLIAEMVLKELDRRAALGLPVWIEPEHTKQRRAAEGEVDAA